MNILITGGLGFIGTHLANRLRREHHDLMLLDNMSHPLSDVPTSAYLSIVASSDANVAKAMKKNFSFTPDIIFHCASPVGVNYVRYGMAKEIIDGTHAMINYASRHGSELVLFSSSEVDDVGLFPYDARAEYALGKKTLECMAYSCGYKYVIVVRPYNVIGPRQQADGGYVVPIFLEAIKKNKPLVVHGDGLQRRMFTSVHDIVDFCVLLLARWPAKGIYNLGNPGNVCTILHLAETMNRLAGRPDNHDIFTSGLSRVRDAMPRSTVDIKAAQDLGWQPRRSLEDCLKEIIAKC